MGKKNNCVQAVFLESEISQVKLIQSQYIVLEICEVNHCLLPKSWMLKFQQTENPENSLFSGVQRWFWKKYMTVNSKNEVSPGKQESVRKRVKIALSSLWFGVRGREGNALSYFQNSVTIAYINEIEYFNVMLISSGVINWSNNWFPERAGRQVGPPEDRSKPVRTQLIFGATDSN